MHPKIEAFVQKLREANLDANFYGKENQILSLLRTNDSSSTEAMVVLHQYYQIKESLAEKVVKDSNLWEPEDIEETAYQTFLYLSYDDNR